MKRPNPPAPSLRKATAGNRKEEYALQYALGLLEGYQQGVMNAAGKRLKPSDVARISVDDTEIIKTLRGIIGLENQADGEAHFSEVIFYDTNWLPF